MTKTNKSLLLRKYISSIENELAKLKKLIDLDHADLETIDLSGIIASEKDIEEEVEEGARVIHGVFDGQQMVCDEGNFAVPANYASKSKMVEGDTLKLTIKQDGTFIYKQTKPVSRKRLVGKVVKDVNTDSFKVIVDKTLYNVLLASVTYFKGAVGDEAVILVPTSGIAQWAAVENIIKPGDAPFDDSVLGL